MTPQPKTEPGAHGDRGNVPIVSFIIPTLNEEHNIELTIKSIQFYASELCLVEIIVVDHGSEDRTVAVASMLGAHIYACRGGTIGSLRNYGAKHACGEVLVFLDADVNLTPAWRRNFPDVRVELERNPLLVTGSHCSAPDDGTWIERYWFSNYVGQAETTHIGSGHLIVRHDAFLRFGGFDEQFETGEDYEFCRRALNKGGHLVNNSRLKVTHRGYPSGLLDFVRREAWHGRGDLGSFSSAIRSKVAVGSAMFIGLHLMIIIGLVAPETLWLVTAAAMAMLVFLLVGSAVIRYRHCALYVIGINAVIFYFYYLGRGLALFGVSQWWRDSRAASRNR